MLLVQALQLGDPQRSGYVVRWPIYGTQFNTRDYPSLQVIINDLELILRSALQEKLGIYPRDYEVIVGRAASRKDIPDSQNRTTPLFSSFPICTIVHMFGI
jgi:hypothetical protein